MMHELRALVIIPAFNEEANILDTVSSVEEAKPTASELRAKLDTIM